MVLLGDADGRRQHRNRHRQVQRFCRGHGISRLELFGSALGKDFSAQSDVDFLATLRSDAHPTLLAVGQAGFAPRGPKRARRLLTVAGYHFALCMDLSSSVPDVFDDWEHVLGVAIGLGLDGCHRSFVSHLWPRLGVSSSSRLGDVASCRQLPTTLRFGLKLGTLSLAVPTFPAGESFSGRARYTGQLIGRLPCCQVLVRVLGRLSSFESMTP